MVSSWLVMSFELFIKLFAFVYIHCVKIFCFILMKKLQLNEGKIFTQILNEKIITRIVVNKNLKTQQAIQNA